MDNTMFVAQRQPDPGEISLFIGLTFLAFLILFTFVMWIISLFEKPKKRQLSKAAEQIIASFEPVGQWQLMLVDAQQSYLQHITSGLIIRPTHNKANVCYDERFFHNNFTCLSDFDLETINTLALHAIRTIETTILHNKLDDQKTEKQDCS